MQDRVLKHPKIVVVWDSVVDEIIGDEKPVLSVTGVRVKNLKTGQTHTIPSAGIFVAIGHDPATKIFHDKLTTDSEGYILTKPDSTATSIPGVYAAGDVKDKVFRQAVTAAGMGCMAALEAEKFLASNEDEARNLKVAS